MKLVKKLFTLSLFVLVALSLVGCKKKPVDQKKVLTVGTPGLSGDFISGFGSSAYDVYVRDLIHGYGTLVETEAGEFVWDTKTVLKKAPETVKDGEGNKTYKFELQDDLKWNNGEAITAKDFVLSVLLKSSKDWKSVATSANYGYYLVGFAEYNQGLVIGQDDKGNDKYDDNYSVINKVFKGVRLTGELTFELTIDKENLPYFYETTMVSSDPIDLDTYLPGFDVKDDGKGAYIAKDVSKEEEPHLVIAKTIKTTVDSPAVGQRYKPTITCGPYQFVNFIRDIATLELNPNFKGNYEGKKPTIDEINIKKINQKTDVDQVIAGTIDIVSGVVEGAKIQAAKDSKNAKLVSYARNGYGLLAMATDFGPTQYVEVRQALGYLFDRNEFLTQILGGYGTLVNGPYGEAQWFYKESKAELNDALINYVLNADKANEVLNKSIYKFEADGTTAFDAKKASSTNNYFRHDKDGNVLQINHLGTTENDITVLVGLQLKENAWKAGIKYTTEESEWDGLINNYYYGSKLDADKRKYHIFNLATNFYSDYDPYWSWHSSLAGTTNNPTCLQDETLDGIMEQMQKLDPTQKEQFRELFVQFVERWNYLLPNLPLYSNEYFDIFNARVDGLQSTPVWSWAKDICDIKIK